MLLTAARSHIPASPDHEHEQDDMRPGLASLLFNRAEGRTDDTHVSQIREDMTTPQDKSDSELPVPVPTRGQPDSGIIVYSSSGRALYVNNAARQFLTRVNGREHGPSIHEHDPFPSLVADLLNGMLKSLEARTTTGDRRVLQARRLVVRQDQPVLLQAFAIPDRLDIQRSRIVLTLQETPGPLES